MTWCWLAACLLLMIHLSSACLRDCDCFGDEDGRFNANCTSLAFSDVDHSPTLSKIYASISVLNIQLPTGDIGATNKISGGILSAFGKLKYLNLSNCSISHVSHNAFSGLNSVIEVDLSYNKIKFFVPHTFKELYSLRSLILRGNPIQFIPSLSSTPFIISKNLREIDLGCCGLTKLTFNLFVGFQKLTHLILDGNNISVLKPHSLPKTLRYVNLGNNQLTRVPSDVLTSLEDLTHIELSGNPIHCDCHLMGIQDWLSGRGVVFDSDIVCATPQEYAGKSWNSLNENELCEATNSRKNPSKKQRESDYDSFYDVKTHVSKDNTMYEIQGDAPSVDGEISEKYTEVFYRNDKTAIGNSPEVASQLSDNDASGDERTSLLGSGVNESVVSSLETSEAKTFDSDRHDDEVKPKEDITAAFLLENPNTVGANVPANDVLPNEEANVSAENDIRDRTNDLPMEEKDTKETYPNAVALEEKNVSNPVDQETVTMKSEDSVPQIPNGEPDFPLTYLPYLGSNRSNRDNTITKHALSSEDEGDPIGGENASYASVTDTPLPKSGDDASSNGPEAHNERTTDHQTSEDDNVHLESITTGHSLNGTVNRSVYGEIPFEDEMNDNHSEVSNKEFNKPLKDINSENENSQLEDLTTTDAVTDENIEELSVKKSKAFIAESSAHESPSNGAESSTVEIESSEKATTIDIIHAENISSSPPPLHITISQYNFEEDIENNADLVTNMPVNNSFESDVAAKNNDVLDRLAQETTTSSNDLMTSTVSLPSPLIEIVNASSGTEENDAAEVVSEVATMLAEPEGNYSVNITEHMILESEEAEKENDFEAIKDQMGSYILLSCIILVLVLLLVVSLCKRLKSPTNKVLKGRTCKDIETNLGTEMQDMASLLPKHAVAEDGLKKYPEESRLSATEAQALMEEAEALIESGPELEANGDAVNNNKPMAAPRKAPNGASTAPIELARARVGVIADSIPMTPVFVHKRSNGSTNG